MHARRAFTLIELLVVVSIIGLLIAILLPALKAARESAVTLECMSNQRQIGIGLHMYAADYHDYLPYSEGQVYWNNPLTLARALVDEQGGANYLPHDDLSTGNDRWRTQVMQCPGDPNTYGSYNASYAYRQAVNGYTRTRSASVYAVPMRLWNWPTLYRGYNKWLVMDFRQPSSLSANQIARFEYGETSAPGTQPSIDRWSINSPWHNEGANYLYEDGHVKWVMFGVAPAE